MCTTESVFSVGQKVRVKEDAAKARGDAYDAIIVNGIAGKEHMVTQVTERGVYIDDMTFSHVPFNPRIFQLVAES